MFQWHLLLGGSASWWLYDVYCFVIADHAIFWLSHNFMSISSYAIDVYLDELCSMLKFLQILRCVEQLTGMFDCSNM